MCGRYTLRTNPRRFGDLFGIDVPVDLFQPARCNVAPSQEVPAIRATDTGRDAVALRRGLLPRFVADPAKAPKPINARCESVARKPLFRAAFKSRREQICVSDDRNSGCFHASVSPDRQCLI